MPLFEMKPGELVAVPSSTFANEKILERADLQRLLRARIDAIADDVLIVAEEFGAFADARRRIDLLGIDREGRLVVFELKRTLDGGHLELQALRYAAMISTMTFDDLVGHYENYLATVEPEAADEAQARLANWLDDGDGTVISRNVRIVLVSAGFDREITTTVLWLTDLYGLDIRCVRLSSVSGRRPAAARRAAGDSPARSQRADHPAPAEGNTGTRDTWYRWPRLDPVRDHRPRRRERAAPQEASHSDHGHHAAGRWRASQGDRQGHPAFAVPLRSGTLDGAELREAFAAHLPEGRPRPLVHGEPDPWRGTHVDRDEDVGPEHRASP